LNTKRKLLAYALIAMITVHAYGLLNICTFYRAYAASDTYSVTNTIFFNATALGGYAQTYRIDVTEEAEPYAHDDPIFKTGVRGGYTGGFPFQEEQDLLQLQATDDAENAVYFDDFMGELDFNLTGAARAQATTYNNHTLAVNLSDFYDFFEPTHFVFPVTEKRILFDSPANIVNDYCDANGLVLVDIINSTYTEDISVSTLNTFDSQLIATNWYITEPIDEDGVPLSKAKAGLMDDPFLEYGGELKAIATSVLLLIGVIVAMFFVTAAWTIISCMRIQASKELALADMWNSLTATIATLNNETQIQLDLVENKAANEALILELYANGTISFEEAMALLTKIGASYDPLLSNRTQNLGEILDNYFNHIENQWSNYQNALGISSSWMNWIQILIIAAIMLAGIYIVFGVILKKGPKNPVNPVVNIVK